MVDREHEISRLNWEIVKAAIEWRKAHSPVMGDAEQSAANKLRDAIDARESFATSGEPGQKEGQ
jgi:hypothetical protein